MSDKKKNYRVRTSHEQMLIDGMRELAAMEEKLLAEMGIELPSNTFTEEFGECDNNNNKQNERKEKMEENKTMNETVNQQPQAEQPKVEEPKVEPQPQAEQPKVEAPKNEPETGSFWKSAAIFGAGIVLGAGAAIFGFLISKK